jgi:hypothetical protein
MARQAHKEAADLKKKLEDAERKAKDPCDNPPRKIPYYRLRPIHFGR